MTDFAPQLPAGTEVEVVFLHEQRPSERGWADELDTGARGFILHQLAFQEKAGFRQGVEIRIVRKWVNFDAVAEIRFLDEGTLAGEIDYHRELNRRLREDG